jgi:glutathione-regulated potassium-efflux system protein KefB
MVKAGDHLGGRLRTLPASENAEPAADLDRHVVIIGYDEVGQLIDLMLQKANIPHIAVDRDYNIVRQGKAAGRAVYFGDMASSVTQEAIGLGKAAAVYVTLRDTDHAKTLSVTLHRLYPNLDVYIRVRTLADQAELVAKGIQHARTGYIESTLARGGMLLKDLGLPEDDTDELVKDFRQNDYALIRAAYAEIEKQQQQR